MKAFITGATGFIGNRLVCHLAEQGHTVHALCRTPSKAPLLQHANIKICKGNLLDADSIQQAMTGCDTVFHLAAYARVWSKQPELYHRINVEGTKHILEAAQRQNVKRVVFTSSAGTIGPAQNGQPAHEEIDRAVDFFTDYEATKFEAEQMVKRFAENGLEVVTVNPTRVYGPGLLTGSNAVTKMIKLYLEGKWRILPGSGEQLGNYVLVDDVIRGHLAALEKGKPGERYILGSSNVSYQTFFDQLRMVTGKHYRLFKLPIPIIMGASKIQKWGADLFGITPLITPPWARRYMYDWSVSSKKAQKQLNYSPTPLQKGFEKTVNWLHEKTNAD